jgi:hypothetical protein
MGAIRTYVRFIGVVQNAAAWLRTRWQTYPRPTEAMFQGEDTRLGALYTAPRRKQYAVASRRP